MNAALLFSEADYSSGRIVIPISDDERDECVCPYETYKTLLSCMREYVTENKTSSCRKEDVNYLLFGKILIRAN